MNKEKITKLLTAAGPDDQVKLSVLHNAVVKCIKEYKAEPTTARLTAWQKSESALDAFVDGLWAVHFPDDRTFPGIPAVMEYLSGQGWKIKRTAIYAHKKEGKIRPQGDGTFRLADVLRYAENYLPRKDGSQSGDLDKLQREKLLAEIKKTAAQAEHWENRARESSAAFISREVHDRDLARRAALFRNDLEAFARAEAGEIVSVAGGDPGRTPDVVTWLLQRFDTFLANYSADRQFEIQIPRDFKDDRDETDDAEEDADE